MGGSPPQALRLALLSGFELRRGGEVIALELSAQRLMAFLALHAGPLRRLYVSGSLWGDSSERQANASLRTALWRLRRPGCAVVEATHTQLALAGAVAVDVREVSARAQRALANAPQAGDLPALCSAGDLLLDWYDDWVLLERERLRHLRLHALEALCTGHAARGRFAEATEAGLAAVAGDPLRESAHRALIGAHLAEDNVVAAVRQYTAYRDLVARAFGLEPSAQLRKLVEGLPLQAT
jgi:DNA-binding SARP family transcriptional activator